METETLAIISDIGNYGTKYCLNSQLTEDTLNGACDADDLNQDLFFEQTYFSELPKSLQQYLFKYLPSSGAHWMESVFASDPSIPLFGEACFNEAALEFNEFGPASSPEEKGRVWEYIRARLDPPKTMHPGPLESAKSIDSFVNLHSFDVTSVQQQNEGAYFFEQMGAANYFCISAQLVSLYAQGYISGIVIDIGRKSTRINPVVAGYLQKSQSKIINFGGDVVTDKVAQILKESYSTDFGPRDRNLLSKVKAHLCCVRQSPALKTTPSPNSNTSQENESVAPSVTLPDGHCVTLGSKQFDPLETFFSMQPSFAELLETVFRSQEIFKAESILTAISVSGHTSKFSGFIPRMKADISRHFTDKESARVLNSCNGQFIPVCGGAILASLSSFSQQWITKQQYDESGPAIIPQKADFEKI